MYSVVTLIYTWVVNRVISQVINVAFIAVKSYKSWLVIVEAVLVLLVVEECVAKGVPAGRVGQDFWKGVGLGW